METIVIKFGGSSVADNSKLQLVANKVIKLYDEDNNVVVVVSAQGKKTDQLIKEAEELSLKPDKREMDALISVGEQISASKLAILLNYLGYQAISLTGWQAGIHTSDENQNAKIEYIDCTRIEQELDEGKIVQGINDNNDITTLGRGGSDTTAVALAASLKAKQCYIYSDVDGIYSADPNKVEGTRKLTDISYEEMHALSSEGAKVLHNRCVEIGDKFKIPIITKSTFNHKPGTVISDIIEENTIKSIIKKDISRISIVGNGIIRNFNSIHDILKLIEEEKLEILNFEISESKISITFKDIIEDKIVDKFHSIIFK